MVLKHAVDALHLMGVLCTTIPPFILQPDQPDNLVDGVRSYSVSLILTPSITMKYSGSHIDLSRAQLPSGVASADGKTHPNLQHP